MLDQLFTLIEKILALDLCADLGSDGWLLGVADRYINLFVCSPEKTLLSGSTLLGGKSWIGRLC